jgi:flagellar assembly protein FliH
MSSSRILTGNDADVRPIAWRQAPRESRPQVGPNLYAEKAPPTQDASPEAGLRELEQQSQAAYQRGFQEGEAAGRQAAEARLQPVLDKLGQTIRDLGGYRGRLRQEAEADLVRLAVAIARRILRRELSVDPEALLGVVRAALERISARERCSVRLHPSQVETVQRYLEGGARTVEIIGDHSLEPGDTVFESSAGAVDAGIETQLNEIERGLADLAGDRGARWA